MNDRRDYAGMAALVLATCLGLGWALAMLLAASPWTDTISQPGVELLSGIGQVLAGAVAAFLGVSVGRRAERQDDSLRQQDPAQPPASPSDEPAALSGSEH